jgi:GMP synthase (glutamine-hydrolysing)
MKASQFQKNQQSEISRFRLKVIGLEPLVQLRKPAIRRLAKVLGLPAEIYDQPPFPGPALATRIVGEVTSAKVQTVRTATSR